MKKKIKMIISIILVIVISIFFILQYSIYIMSKISKV